MHNLEKRGFYRRDLPHYHLTGHEFFITTRLAGSIPVKNKEKLKFSELEEFLHKGTVGPTWLSDPKVGQIVWDALFFRNGKVIDLHALFIMPNHIHLVFHHLSHQAEDLKQESIQGIMHSLKRFTALKCNQELGRKGQFWEVENFDRLIRNDKEWDKTIYYVINNPVKAGLVKHWRDWPWTYCKYERA